MSLSPLCSAATVHSIFILKLYTVPFEKQSQQISHGSLRSLVLSFYTITPPDPVAMSAPVEKPRIAPTQGVGPDYRSPSQRPTATVSTDVELDTVTVLNQTPQLIALLT